MAHSTGPAGAGHFDNGKGPVAYRLEKGCNVAAAEQPDLILMDLEMPVVDRWEATRRLKGKPQTRDMPVIGLSRTRLPVSVRRRSPRAAKIQRRCLSGTATD